MILTGVKLCWLLSPSAEQLHFEFDGRRLQVPPAPPRPTHPPTLLFVPWVVLLARRYACSVNPMVDVVLGYWACLAQASDTPEVTGMVDGDTIVVRMP